MFLVFPLLDEKSTSVYLKTVVLGKKTVRLHQKDRNVCCKHADEVSKACGWRH